MQNNNFDDDADENNPLIQNNNDLDGEQECDFCTVFMYLLETHLYIFVFVFCIVGIIRLFDVTNNMRLDGDLILYFTDVHIDPNYVYRKSAEKEYCHKIEQGEHIKDFKYGQYGCDSPVELVDSFYEYLQTSIIPPKLIIFGGDLSCTIFGNNTLEIVKNNWKSMMDKLEEIYPDAEFIFTMGNGEYVPNYGSFETDSASFANIYSVVSKHLNEEQSKTFLKGGYYYYDTNKTNYRFIMLNSILYSHRRENSTIEDPYDQFKWLSEVMNTDKKIVIVLHIQTGVSYATYDNSWYPQYIQQITKIFAKRKPDYILGAHNHIDLLMPLFTDEKLNLITMSNPSISPQHDNNPAFRTYTFNDVGIRDYTQYYFDIQNNPLIPEWEKEYRFYDLYKQRNLSHESLREVLQYQQSTSKGRWQLYRHVRTGNFPHNSFYKCIGFSQNKQEFLECINEHP